MNNSHQQSILIIGCGGHARFVISMVRYSSFLINGIIDTKQDFNPDEMILGCKVIDQVGNLSHLYRVGHTSAIVAIGDNSERKYIFNQLKDLKFTLPTIAHPSAFIDPSANIGKGNVIGPNSVIGAEVVMGDNNIINSSTVIEHQTVIGSHCHIAPSATLCGKVQIGDSVLLGANSTVLPNKTIANETILGAGSTLINSVNETGKIFIGVPARENIL